MKNKTVPLPCTDEQYKTIKMFCLVNGIKYAQLTKIIVKLIKEIENDNNTI